jgi:hypothetical protein
MLKITVEILPGGSAVRRRTVGLMLIGNVSNLADVSDYEIDVTEAANPLTGTAPRSTGFFVRNHSRRQSVWRLLGASIAQMEQAEWDEL